MRELADVRQPFSSRMWWSQVRADARKDEIYKLRGDDEGPRSGKLIACMQYSSESRAVRNALQELLQDTGHFAIRKEVLLSFLLAFLLGDIFSRAVLRQRSAVNSSGTSVRRRLGHKALGEYLVTYLDQDSYQSCYQDPRAASGHVSGSFPGAFLGPTGLDSWLDCLSHCLTIAHSCSDDATVGS